LLLPLSYGYYGRENDIEQGFAFRAFFFHFLLEVLLKAVCMGIVIARSECKDGLAPLYAQDWRKLCLADKAKLIQIFCIFPITKDA
jgi:hypothetical protein